MPRLAPPIAVCFALAACWGCGEAADPDAALKVRQAEPLELTLPPGGGGKKHYALVRRMQDRNFPDERLELEGEVEVEIVELLADGGCRLNWTYGNLRGHTTESLTTYKIRAGLPADLSLKIRVDKHGKVVELENADDIVPLMKKRLDASDVRLKDQTLYADWAKATKKQVAQLEIFLSEVVPEVELFLATCGRTYKFGESLEETGAGRPSTYFTADSVIRERFLLRNFRGAGFATAIIDLERTHQTPPPEPETPKPAATADKKEPEKSERTTLTTFEIDVATRWPVKWTHTRDEGSPPNSRSATFTLSLIGRP